MRLFSCDVCGSRLFFDNSRCLTCGTAQGFRLTDLELVALTDEASDRWCVNADLAACNWLAGPDGLCASCALTTTRPNDADPEGLAEFAIAEAAKRRLLYGLRRLALPIDDRISFDLLSSSAESVITGHADGTVTLDLAESDPAVREQRRAEMGEPYRTLLGHFRHEIGHYYQGVIVEGDWNRCRELFGDERADYQAAMDRHYEQGAPGNWASAHVSAYATMHPWEDWAETFAHYLHMRDTLETADALGFFDARGADSFEPIIEAWLPLSAGLNEVNRSMGQADLYPFVLAEPVVEKLRYVHERVAASVVTVSRRAG